MSVHPESQAVVRERLIEGVADVLGRLQKGESLTGDSVTLYIAWARARQIGIPVEEIKREAESRLEKKQN